MRSDLSFVRAVKTFICRELSGVRPEQHFSTLYVIVEVDEFVNKFAPREVCPLYLFFTRRYLLSCEYRQRVHSEDLRQAYIQFKLALLIEIERCVASESARTWSKNFDGEDVATHVEEEHCATEMARKTSGHRGAGKRAGVYQTTEYYLWPSRPVLFRGKSPQSLRYHGVLHYRDCRLL